MIAALGCGYQQIDASGPLTRSLDPDRFINGINGFGRIGTTQFLLDRMDRPEAIADDGDHLTKAANQLLVSDILVPSILRFAKENAIRL